MEKKQAVHDSICKINKQINKFNFQRKNKNPLKVPADAFRSHLLGFSESETEASYSPGLNLKKSNLHKLLGYNLRFILTLRPAVK